MSLWNPVCISSFFPHLSTVEIIVDYFSTGFPLLLKCGKVWKTHKSADIKRDLNDMKSGMWKTPPNFVKICGKLMLIYDYNLFKAVRI